MDPTPVAHASVDPPDETVPVGMHEVAVPDDLPAFVLRGERAHRLTVVFVPGMCVHPLGYAQSFQHTTAARGVLLAVQGDQACSPDGVYRRWTNDPATMVRRIDAAYRAAGLGDRARDVVLVGYSQGAERAERLIEAFPERFTRVILIASPIEPSARRLGRVRAAVMMAGTRDANANMHAGVRALARSGIAVTFVALPGASHGQMGEAPEVSMTEALDFIEEHSGASTK